METTKLKKFAQAARRSLMAQVATKLKLVLATDSAARRENPKAVATLEKAIEVMGQAQVIERVAYTWFNRFCALRFMDVNRYNRIGIVSPAEEQTQPEILAEAKMGLIDEDMVPEKIRQQVLDLLSGKAPSRDPQGEAYRLLVVAACNFWNKAMPFLFQRIDDYTELLMPDDLLSGNSILATTREAMTTDACEDVEVIGWLYQFYISEKKDEVFDGLKKNKKITPENIPAATQLFTPHWIVRYLVENSLGRLWLLNRPGSKLIEQMDYYIKPVESGECEVGSKSDSSHSPLATSHLRISSPEEIRICDPACGSGHMLTYAFDLLYAIYEEEGVDPAEIPEKILTNNLYGIEIDERAGELAAFALTMKARSRSRRFFRKAVKPNICVLENVTFDAGELAAVGSEKWVVGSEKRQALHHDLHLFEEADNFGSLLRPQLPLEDIQSLQRTIHSTLSTSHSLFDSMTHQKALQALRQADYLSPKYHVVIANPPYMGGKGMNGRLAAWVKGNYPNTKSDLFAMFIERNLELAQKHGAVAMITMQSWMFLSSFEALRARILNQGTLLAMAHLGARAFDSIGGEVVSTTAFVLENAAKPDYIGRYLRLVNGNSETEKEKAIREAVNNIDCGWFFRASAADFKKIPGYPIAYWANGSIFSAFDRSNRISSLSTLHRGISTGNTDLFAKLWHEVPRNNLCLGANNREEAKLSGTRWFPYNRGGAFRKWYGLGIDILDYEDGGHRMIAAAERGESPGFRHDGAAEYFLPTITWTALTAGKPSFRLLEAGYVLGHKGSSIKTSESNRLSLLALFNSNALERFLEYISPTLDINIHQISSLPLPESPDFHQASAVASTLVEISKNDCSSLETCWDFTSLPLLNPDYHQPTLKATYQKLRAHWREITLEMQRLEQENNRIFIDAYGLNDELDEKVDLNEITLTCSPHYRYGVEECEVGSEKWEEMEARLLQDTMKELVSYALGCMFGRYSLDMPGLVLANQGETISDYYKKVMEHQKSEREKLSGTDCLAEGDGLGGTDLSGEQNLSQGGTVRPDEPNSQGRSVDSLQHSRRASQTIDSGVQKLSIDSTGFQSRSGNSTDDRSTIGLSFAGESGANSESIRGNQADDLLPDSEAALASHSPLPTSHLSFVPDEDNVIPMLDGDWFTDDIAERFRKFLRVAFGDEHYEANLRFVEASLNIKGKRNYSIRDYFLGEFYNDHVKRYKKRPIYWLFSSGSGKAGGSFNALIYMHRYRPDTVSVILNGYLREFRTKLAAQKSHLEAVSISASASQGEKTKALKEIERINKILVELDDYERDILYPLATEQVTIDLDDGVKVNYPKFGKALKPIAGLEGKDD
jgi:hypothetical protein